jgi:hypothetical protein
MKAKSLVALVVIGLLVLAQGAFAQDKGEKKKRGPGGKVKAIDTTANTITVTMGRKGETPQDKTYKLAKEVKVSIDGEAKALSDVTVGANVRLRLGAGDEVTEINIGGRKKKKE